MNRAPIESVTLPVDPLGAARAIIAWLAYPDPLGAAKAIALMDHWEARMAYARNSSAPKPTMRVDRLVPKLNKLETLLRRRLIAGQTWGLKIGAAMMNLPQVSTEMLSENDSKIFNDIKNSKSLFREGGKLSGLQFGNWSISLNMPPVGSRALARSVGEKNGGEESANVRRIIAESKPVMHLAIGCHHHITPKLCNQGLHSVVFNAGWVASAMHASARARRDLIDLTEFEFEGSDLIQFEWPSLPELPPIQIEPVTK